MTCPPFIRLTCLILSIACCASAIGGVVVSLIGTMFFLTAFEVVVVFASAFGVIAGLGRLRGVEAATMLVNGGVVFVGAVLGVPEVITALIQGGSALKPVAAGIDLVPWFIFRMLAAAGLIGMSGALVVMRTPRQSTAHLVRGVLVGLPVVVLGGALLAPGVRQSIAQMAPPIMVFLGAVGFLIVASLVSVSGHNLLRAFEVGIEAGERESLSQAPERPSEKAPAGES